MNKYEGYRDISLPWLKSIPDHWKIVRNKNIFSESKETVGECFNDYTLLSLTLGGVIIRDLSEGKGKFPKDFETYKIVKQGDIIFCLFDMDETPRTVGLSKNNGMITGAYDVFHINGVNSQFIYYYYLSLDNAKALRPLYSGLRKTIKVGSFLGTKLPLPPRDEQDQIVRFLDWKVSSINRLINIKKKEIKEIEALKKSLIDDCVTHGLNPDAPMKDSGVRWLGQIPAHWKLVRNKNIFSEAKDTVGELFNNYTLLSLTLGGVIIRDVSEGKGKFPKDFETYKIVEKGDIIFCLFDMDETPRTVGLSNNRGMITGAYDVFHIKGVNPKFIYYYYLSLDNAKALRPLYSGLRKTIKMDDFLGIKSPIPPFEEQNEIVKYLENRLNKYDNFIEKIKEEIALLNELKSRLISDAVTGQIDVRDVKIPSFDMVEEDLNEEHLENNDETEESGEVE